MKATLICIITVLFLFIFPLNIWSDEIKEVHWASPEWEEFTNKDGTGIYNEIIDKVFGAHNIKIVREYYPWRRALIVVKKGNADMTGGLDRSKAYLQSKYPIYENKEVVFFKKSNFKRWEGINSLKGKIGVWYLGYVDSLETHELKNMLKGHGNKSRASAIKMVLHDRADYYFDNIKQMMIAIENKKNQFNMNDYQIEPVAVIQLFMSFTNSNRGEKIRKIYDKGIEKLYHSGELEKIYRKWNASVPKLNVK